jgi:hypothetical protein
MLRSFRSSQHFPPPVSIAVNACTCVISNKYSVYCWRTRCRVVYVSACLCSQLFQNWLARPPARPHQHTHIHSHTIQVYNETADLAGRQQDKVYLALKFSISLFPPHLLILLPGLPPILPPCSLAILPLSDTNPSVLPSGLTNCSLKIRHLTVHVKHIPTHTQTEALLLFEVCRNHCISYLGPR